MDDVGADFEGGGFTIVVGGGFEAGDVPDGVDAGEGRG